MSVRVGGYIKSQLSVFLLQSGWLLCGSLLTHVLRQSVHLPPWDAVGRWSNGHTSKRPSKVPDTS